MPLRHRQVTTAIEYHYQTYYRCTLPDDFILSYVGSYFVTANPDEIAALDTGGRVVAHRGNRFASGANPSSGTLPTCRFFDPAVGAHFLTPYVAECSALQADPRWTYEGTAFHVQVPDGNGHCRGRHDDPLSSVQPGHERLAVLHARDGTTGRDLHRYTTSVHDIR